MPTNVYRLREPGLRLALGHELAGRQELRDAEVEHLRLAGGRQRDVRRLQIAMNDAHIVRGGKRVRDLGAHLERLLDRQRAGAEPLGERLPFEILHDNERTPCLVRAGIEDGTDIGMLDGGRRPGPLSTGGAQWWYVGLLIRNELDGNLTFEQEVVRQIHVSHAA